MLHLHVKVYNSNLNPGGKGTCQRSYKSHVELVLNGMFLMSDVYSTESGGSGAQHVVMIICPMQHTSNTDLRRYLAGCWKFSRTQKLCISCLHSAWHLSKAVSSQQSGRIRKRYMCIWHTCSWKIAAWGFSGMVPSWLGRLACASAAHQALWTLSRAS